MKLSDLHNVRAASICAQQGLESAPAGRERLALLANHSNESHVQTKLPLLFLSTLNMLIYFKMPATEMPRARHDSEIAFIITISSVRKPKTLHT
jgi:hypothetical protein